MENERTGLHINEDERATLEEFWRDANTPLFGMTDKMVFSAAKRIDEARASFYTGVDAAAVRLGLPEPQNDAEGGVIHYGLDFSNDELLRGN